MALGAAGGVSAAARRAVLVYALGLEDGDALKLHVQQELAGWLAGWLAGLLAGFLAAWQLGCLAAWLLCC